MIFWEKMYMTSTVTELRISKAQKAQAAAQNPDFKEYWRKVTEALQRAVDHD